MLPDKGSRGGVKKKKKKKHKQLEGTYISNPEKKALSSSSVVA